MKVRVGLALALALVAGCNSKKITGPNQSSKSNTNQNNATQVNQYLDSLPSWATFSPLAQTDTVATDTATTSDTTVASVTTIDAAGDTSTATNVPYVCETTPYNIEANPQQIVMFSPDQSILYPGAFIQGKSYSTLGSLLGLKIDKRAPIKVSIPAFTISPNYQQVDTVDEADVESAVASLVSKQWQSGTPVSSSIYYHWGSYYTESQYAFSMNASAHYLGFSASGEGSIKTSASLHTVAATFYEKMFTVDVEPPSTPAGWFASDFTRADLQQQVDQGKIGPDNLPVYVGEIVYGRMMMFSLTSTASSSDIQAAINASYNGLVGGGSVSLSAEQKKILETATVEVATVGGSDSAAINAIRTGDFKQYFTSSTPLSTAAPLVYQFHNLASNKTAQVSEATSYKLRTCHQVAAPSAGQFDFQPEQDFAPPVSTPFETRLVDVNGDSRADLVFNHRDANSNEVAVALGKADGTFAAPGAAVSVPGTPPGGWANYTLVTGDFNGDGMADLVWNDAVEMNATYVALADGSGGWTFKPLQETSSGGWAGAGYHLYAGDVLKPDHPGQKACDDLIWDQVSTGNNYVAIALSECDGSFGFPTHADELGTGGWANFTMRVADANQDGVADLCFMEINPYLWFETFVSNGYGTFTQSYNQNYASFPSVQPLLGDFNGNGLPDWLLYESASAGASRAWWYVDMNHGEPWIDMSFLPNIGGFKALEGDVNGDGAEDLIVESAPSSENTNDIAVMLGNPNGITMNAVSADSLKYQTYPASVAWSTALPAMVGDVNGNHDADVVWVIPGSTTQVFVAVSRGSATGS